MSKEDDDFILASWSAMSPASIGACLGWSAERVERRRAQLILQPLLKVAEVAASGRPIVRLDPLKPNVRRWVSWFLSAGWAPRDVAWLFDCQESDVRWQGDFTLKRCVPA